MSDSPGSACTSRMCTSRFSRIARQESHSSVGTIGNNAFHASTRGRVIGMGGGTMGGSEMHEVAFEFDQ